MFTKRSVFLAMLLILALAGMILRPVSAKTVNLQFIETTDIHGSLFPYDFITAKEAPTSLAQAYTYVKAQRATPISMLFCWIMAIFCKGSRPFITTTSEKTDAVHVCAEIMISCNMRPVWLVTMM